MTFSYGSVQLDGPACIMLSTLLDSSPLHRYWIDGSMDNINFRYSLNGITFNMLLFLADGICLKLARFVKGMSELISIADKNVWNDKNLKKRRGVCFWCMKICVSMSGESFQILGSTRPY